ncbi:hypothetical protein FNF29_05109 [Cafeteria roenbergensis]|uniref:Uncharacterized protein n=1 Tax=Cafeteria roenbergensis TaxID=33653 RepID=A0A5A8CDY3_CAFRO|nr:hypothetical protein FNF29_05109 [Cafeteria roenbergensis]|eukprot:KAA0150774.1 hypothetical protein FNF29_05109 [Cafeteria roenbergensis]
MGCGASTAAKSGERAEPINAGAPGPRARDAASSASQEQPPGRAAAAEHNSDAASVDIAGAELGAQPEPAEQPGALGAEGKGDLADDAPGSFVSSPGSRISSPGGARGSLRPRHREPSRQSYIEARDSFRELETAALSTKQETLQQQRDLAERRSARQGSHWNAELEQRTQATAAARQFREGMPSRGAAKMSWSETMSRAVIDRSDTLPDAKKKFTQLDSQASHTTGTLHRAHTLPGLAMTQAARQARPPPPGPSPGGAALSPPLPGGTTAAGSTGAGSTGAGSFPEGGSTPAAADPGPGDAEGERPKPAPASEGSPARDGAGLA